MQVNGVQLGQGLINEDEIKIQGKVVSDFSEKITSKRKEWEINPAEKTDKSGYDKPEAKKASEDILLADGGFMTAEDRKDQMVLMSENAGDKELDSLKEEGVSPLDADAHKVVTVVEKIQAKMAAQGKDLGLAEVSEDALVEAAGSEIMANSLRRVLDEGASITEPDDNAISYIISNDLNPTIHNIYIAEHSVVKDYAHEKNNNVSLDFSTDDSMRQSIEKVIVASGEEVSEESFDRAQFLLENDLPLNATNLEYVKNLKEMTIPTQEELIDMINSTVEKGLRPEDTVLIEGTGIADIAENAVNIVNEATDEDIAYLVSEDIPLSVENLKEAKELKKSGYIDAEKVKAILDSNEVGFVHAKRVLEETRLIMTEEANITLMRKGIHIDTEELETLVEDLKQIEDNYYKTLFDADSVEDVENKTALYKDTTQSLEEIKMAPMYILGIPDADVDTILGLREAGRTMTAEMQKAEMSYETLQTEVRPDLGDNIKTAFRNVDDILEDMGLQPTVENERAVKILGYNSMEINMENINTMKAADEQVQRTFSVMTPLVVRELIKQGENPMTMNLEELTAKATEIKESIADESDERFSSFLYKLEKNNEITEAEKQSFIGIYRLINQVEKSDGAVIGALVAAGRELSFSNLLSAVRSSKKNDMDYTVNDEFETVESTINNGIDTQIETAYQMNLIKDVAEMVSPMAIKYVAREGEILHFTPETLKQAMRDAGETEEVKTEEADYRSYENASVREQIETAKNAEIEVYRLLENFGMDNTVNNVLAMNYLASNRGQIFKQLFKYEEEFSREDVDFEGIREELLEKFSEALKTPEEMAEAQNALAERAEHIMDGYMPDSDNVTELDVKAMKLVNRQLSIASNMAKDETYTIPVMVGDELTGMTLKLVHGTEKKGLIDILFETDSLGKVALSLKADAESVSGLMASDSNETLEKVKASGIFDEYEMSFAYSEKLDLTKMFAKLSAVRSEGEAADESNVKEGELTVKELYSKAKEVMESLKNIR
ncbi:MAG: DUF6240 domain-containing protein [Lachnospiraceae bacterium]|nr:DUF6240 domain-containing protein [Lachnospiraceae bacterium]